MDFMNRWLTPESVMWTTGLLSIVLLVLVRQVSEVITSRRRDSNMRFMKIGLFLILPLMVIFPALVLLTGEMVRGTSCGFYLLSFSLFCYYLGKTNGAKSGRQDLSDLIGLDLLDNAQDAQDRLYESRLRYPSRGDVTKAIKAISRGKKPPPTAYELPDEPPPASAVSQTSDVLDVMVEEV